MQISHSNYQISKLNTPIRFGSEDNPKPDFPSGWPPNKSRRKDGKGYVTKDGVVVKKNSRRRFLYLLPRIGLGLTILAIIGFPVSKIINKKIEQNAIKREAEIQLKNFQALLTVNQKNLRLFSEVVKETNPEEIAEKYTEDQYQHFWNTFSTELSEENLKELSKKPDYPNVKKVVELQSDINILWTKINETLENRPFKNRERKEIFQKAFPESLLNTMAKRGQTTQEQFEIFGGLRIAQGNLAALQLYADKLGINDENLKLNHHDSLQKLYEETNSYFNLENNFKIKQTRK